MGCFYWNFTNLSFKPGINDAIIIYSFSQEPYCKWFRRYQRTSFFAICAQVCTNKDTKQYCCTNNSKRIIHSLASVEEWRVCGGGLKGAQRAVSRLSVLNNQAERQYGFVSCCSFYLWIHFTALVACMACFTRQTSGYRINDIWHTDWSRTKIFNFLNFSFT